MHNQKRLFWCVVLSSVCVCEFFFLLGSLLSTLSLTMATGKKVIFTKYFTEYRWNWLRHIYIRFCFLFQWQFVITSCFSKRNFTPSPRCTKCATNTKACERAQQTKKTKTSKKLLFLSVCVCALEKACFYPDYFTMAMTNDDEYAINIIIGRIIKTERTNGRMVKKERKQQQRHTPKKNLRRKRKWKNK